MHNRLKQIRKAVNLTQAEFAEKLGVKPNTITSYETCLRVPSETVVLAICREFHVNENWLRTGEGEMFLPLNKSDELAAFFGDLLHDTPDFRHRLITVLSRMSTEEWKMLESLAHRLVEEMQEEEEQKEKPDP